MKYECRLIFEYLLFSCGFWLVCWDEGCSVFMVDGWKGWGGEDWLWVSFILVLVCLLGKFGLVLLVDWVGCKCCLVFVWLCRNWYVVFLLWVGFFVDYSIDGIGDVEVCDVFDFI